MSAAIPANPEFLRPWLGAGLRGALIFYSVCALVLIITLLCWLRWGRGPRRRRTYRQAKRLLQQKDWRRALDTLQVLRSTGKLSTMWTGRARNIEGECMRLAGEADLTEGRFEESLERFRSAAALLNLDAHDYQERIKEQMLAEVRRRFAHGNKTDEVLTLIERALKLQPGCEEALFWRALCQVRSGLGERAVATLRETVNGTARAQPQALDPLLYLGALLLRQGQTQEALRHLSEANRLCPESPFVSLLLGSAIVASGGDQMALRPLQRALGAQGFQGWNKLHQRAWVEGLPGPNGQPASGKGRSLVSYVRRLASEHAFHCPVFGDVTALVRQGWFALGQAHYRLGRYQESADLFGKVLQEGAPTVPVLRGLGLSLARLERYDEAFKHLRAAFEQEEPKNHLTAGYLALCGARGKPNKAEDKANNVAWAIQLLGRFSVLGDREWAGLVSGVFTEARACDLSVPAKDRERLCQVLASVEAVDASAASSFEELYVAAPEAVRQEHAWLYCRAAQVHNTGSLHGLDLFARTCGDDPAARAFFGERQWNFDDVQYAYLERLARWRDDWLTRRNGTADEPSPEFVLRPAQEQLLLERSMSHEAGGDLETAIAAVEVLHRLAPHHRTALDRLAQLHYRKGNLESAAACLAEQHALDPQDSKPLIQRAIIEQQCGNPEAAFNAIQQALSLTDSTKRAAVAFLGARLALANYFKTANRGCDHPSWQQAAAFLQTCLQHQPDHTEALWRLAAMRAAEGNRAGLAALAADLRRPEVEHALYHYMGAVSNLAAGAPQEAIAAAERVASSGTIDAEQPPTHISPLELESAFVLGWALQQQNESDAAIEPLKRIAGTRGPSADQARALLGKIYFQRADYDNAVLWWSAIDAGKRAALQLDKPLRDTVLLTGLLALQAERFEQAGDRFREAARIGNRDPRIEQLARIKAAQQLLYTETQDLLDTRPAENAAWLLKNTIQDGCSDANVGYLLALAYKRQDNLLETRNALRQIMPPDAYVRLQLALLSIREARSSGIAGAPLVQAEQELEQAWQWCQDARQAGTTGVTAISYAVGFDLLCTRLSLGKIAEAIPLLSPLLELTSQREEQQPLLLLQALLQSSQAPPPQEQEPPSASNALLAEMNRDDEEVLLNLVRGLGHLETSGLLLKALATVRRESLPVRQATIELGILQAKQLLDRGQALQAERLLTGLWGDRAAFVHLSDATQIIYHNLRGCCAVLCQDFESGAKHFRSALNLREDDARLQQNMALTHELQGRILDGDPHWNRYLDLLDTRLPMPPVRPDGEYHERLAFESLTRLAQRNSDRENWSGALTYLQRAHQLRPDDVDTLEKLFHLNNQLKRVEDARRTLDYLRHVRADAPQLELYELELIEIKSMDDIERLLAEIERVRQKYPGDAVVSERAGSMVGNVINFLNATSKQHREQLHKTTRSLNRLQSHQVNWPEVHKFLRSMRSALVKMKKAIDRCQPLAVSEQQRRQLQQLRQKIEADIELCRSLSG